MKGYKKQFEPPETRFRRKYVVNPISNCWDWQSRQHKPSKKPTYPVITVSPKGEVMQASHYSLLLAGRPLTPGQCALHHCDNPSCVNPEHLFAGSKRDNALDAVRKGRMVAPFRNKNWLGRKHSAGTRQKMSAAAKRNWATTSPEKRAAHMEKMRAARLKGAAK